MTIFRRFRLAPTVAAGLLALTGSALAASYPSSAAINVPDPASLGSVASAAPSQVTVVGEPTVNRLIVKIFGFTHSQPDDVDILLVGPNGQSVVLLSDAGGDSSAFRPSAPSMSVSGADIGFDDLASKMLPDEGQINSGVFRPTDYGQSPACPGEPAVDTWPLAPPGPYGSNLSSFNGVSPNGTWTLYVVDDCKGFSGALNNGWSLGVNVPTAANVAGFTGRPLAHNVRLTWRTSVESQVLGFNVYRLSGSGKAERLNRTLVPARFSGKANGARYALADSSVRPGASYTYRLQTVGLNGSRSWAGATALQAR